MSGSEKLAVVFGNYLFDIPAHQEGRRRLSIHAEPWVAKKGAGLKVSIPLALPIGPLVVVRPYVSVFMADGEVGV